MRPISAAAVLAVVVLVCGVMSVQAYSPVWQTTTNCLLWTESISSGPGYPSTTFVACGATLYAVNTTNGAILGATQNPSGNWFLTPAIDPLNPISNLAAITMTANSTFHYYVWLDALSNQGWKQLWQSTQFEGSNCPAVPPTGYNGVSYFAAGCFISAYDLAGALLWQVPFSATLLGPLVVARDVLIASTPQGLVAISLEDGKQWWVYPPPASEMFDAPASVSPTGRLIYTATRRGGAIAISSATGKLVYADNNGSRFVTRIIECGNVVAGLSTGSSPWSGSYYSVQTVKLGPSKASWTFFPAFATTLSGLACSQSQSSTLYVTTAYGQFFALNAQAGAIVGNYSAANDYGVRPAVSVTGTPLIVSVGFATGGFFGFPVV